MDLSVYHPALLALAILCFVILFQSNLCAVFAFSKKGGQTPGSLKGTPEDFSFRVLRTYSNSTENLPAFIGALLVAIVAGVDPTWVNGLAGIHVLFRFFYWAVYYSKIGGPTPGLRTLTYVIAMLANLVLVVMSVLALI